MMIYNKWVTLRKTAKSTAIFKIQMFDYLILACVRNGSHVLPAKKGSGGPNTSLLYHLLNEGNWGYKETDGRTMES